MDPNEFPEIRKILAFADNITVDLSLIDEMTAMVANLGSVALQGRFKTRDDLHDIAIALEKVQRQRSRAYEIKFGNLRYLRQLDALMSKGAAVLYQHDYYRKMSPAPVRELAVNLALRPLGKRIVDLKAIVEIADETIKALTSTDFTMRDLIRVNTTYLESERRE